MPSNIIYVGVPGFTAFTLVNLGQSALRVLEGNDFLSGLSTGVTPNGNLVGQISVVFLMLTSVMLIGMGCKSFIYVVDDTDGRLGTFDLWRLGCDVILERTSQAYQSALALCESTGLSKYNTDRQTWWAWTFPLSQSILEMCKTSTNVSAGVVGCFSTYATVFPSKAFGVLNIMFTIFMVIMYVSHSD